MLITHTHPADGSDAVAEAVAATVKAAEAANVQLIATPDEHEKHGEAAAGIEQVADGERPDVCIVLGGDGSILYALRHFADTGVPVFGINFGTIGFLAAVERDQFSEGLERAFKGDFEVMDLPGAQGGPAGRASGGAQRRQLRAAPAWPGRGALLRDRRRGGGQRPLRRVGGGDPGGSTGYNLANAGPILAWGVKGYVVSFIAPHTLAARALVVAPDDALVVRNAAGREPVEISLDGDARRRARAWGRAEIRFEESVSRLAQLPGANFYHRIREKFGKLA